MLPASASCLKMKAEYAKVFAERVRSEMAKADALGINATWSTAKHLDALAATLEANPGAIRDVLGECYNVSQFQQELDKASRKAGKKHFLRDGGKTPAERAESLMESILRQG